MPDKALVITADDWYQDSKTELNAGGYNVATGKIDNLLQKSVVHESWSNTPVGTAHVSQIDPNNWGIFTNQIYNPASGSSFKANVENLSWTAV